MGKIKILITLTLLFLLVYFRLQVRFLNTFSADELKEIGSLQSVRYLIFEFLPTIPGGAPGDYLMVLPFNRLFPSNHYMLAIPGLVSNILVFILLPIVIAKLNIVTKKYIFLASTVARLCFVFDPTLTYQAMEIRPYANLPFYWIMNIFIVSLLLKIDNNKRNTLKTLVHIFLFIILLAAIFIWHYYMVIILLSIYLFFQVKENSWKALFALFLRKSFYAILGGIIVALPFWKYFASQTGSFPYNTFGWLSMSITQIYAIDKGDPRGLAWQNWIYFILLLCMIGVFLTISILFLRSKYNSNIKVFVDNYFRINIFLVALPLAVILLLDMSTSYMFLYRQFVWIMLPFYIANAIAISGMLDLTGRIRK